MRAKLRKAGRLLSNGEYYEFVARTCSRTLPSALIQLGEARINSLDASLIAAPTRRQSIEVRLATAADLPGILACSGDERNEKEASLFRRFLAEERLCFVVVKDGQILGRCWAFFDDYLLTFDAYDKTSIPLRFDSQTVALGNAVVHPAARKEGLGSQLTSGTCQQLNRTYGKNRILFVARSTNVPSLRVQERLGARWLGQLYYVALLGARFLFVRLQDSRARILRCTRDLAVDV